MSRKKPVAMLTGEFTKAELQARKEQEDYLRGTSDISLTPPTHLSKNAKKIYKSIIKNLPEGFLNGNDTHIVGTVADALDKMEEATRLINEIGLVIETNSGLKQNPSISIYNRYFDIFNKGVSNLGLSPSARAKLVSVPKEATKDDLDKILEELL